MNKQFNYASIIWVFCRKQDYLEVEKIHYKALKLFITGHDDYS